MKQTTILVLLLVTFLVSSCSEFSKQEERVLKKDVAEIAIASEFDDVFTDYWNDFIMGYLEDESEEIAERYTFNYYLDERIDMLNYIVEKIDNSYEVILKGTRDYIVEKGLSQTLIELDSIRNIGIGAWSWPEGTLKEKLGDALCHPRNGFMAEAEDSITDYSLKNVRGLLEYEIDSDLQANGAQEDYMYSSSFQSSQEAMYVDTSPYRTLSNIMHVMAHWLMDKRDKGVTIDYCVAIEDRLNSYEVGYSNQKAFLVTFPRNENNGKCSYVFEEVDYDSTCVGSSLLN